MDNFTQPSFEPKQSTDQAEKIKSALRTKKHGTGTLIGTGIGSFVLGALVMVAFSLMVTPGTEPEISASDSGTYQSTDMSSPKKDSPASASVTPGKAHGKVGQELSNGGVVLTVNEVEELPTISLDEKNRMKGFGGIEETAPSREGAKFIRVNTTVFNSGSETWDLTCGLAISTVLKDVDGNRYDPITELYRIPENPECNASLGHGFSDEMTWIYEVPESYELGFFEFTEGISWASGTTATVVDLHS